MLRDGVDFSLESGLAEEIAGFRPMRDGMAFFFQTGIGGLAAPGNSGE